VDVVSIQERPTVHRGHARAPHEAGPVPLFRAMDPRAKGPGTPVDRPVGYGFPVRICDQDPKAPIYLYSATISSIDRSDLAFDAVEPPFGTPISPGWTDVRFDAAATGEGGPTFIANLLIRWGHTLPVGSDPDHPGVLVQVLVGS
jgi:hypothetical protein